MLAAIAAALVLLSDWLLHRTSHAPAMAVVIALLPFPAYLLLVIAIIRLVRDLDELQRKLQLEAAAFCLVSTALASISYGLLQRAGAPSLSWRFVWPVMAVFYGIGYFVAREHYR